MKPKLELFNYDKLLSLNYLRIFGQFIHFPHFKRLLDYDGPFIRYSVLFKNILIHFWAVSWSAIFELQLWKTTAQF